MLKLVLGGCAFSAVGVTEKSRHLLLDMTFGNSTLGTYYGDCGIIQSKL